MVEAFAPAKINLTLHVTGQRADGYHLLDSLVVFADIGDTVGAVASDRLTLAIDGPQAGGLSAEGDNLVLRAARFLDPARTAALTLTKRLPVASGIGGGSSDAAAALRALSQLWDLPLPAAETTVALGGDVPVCLLARPLRMSGIGEETIPYEDLPALDCLLVNPRVSVPTPAVFRALGSKTNLPMGDLPRAPDAAAFCAWLAGMRNDLAAPAQALHSGITDVLNALRATGCLFAGMSGSGATCFALYPPDGRSARKARQDIASAHPEWWSADGTLLGSRQSVPAG